jgi:hypothetical protein
VAVILFVMPRFHKPLPPAELIRSQLHYNKTTGVFTWRRITGYRSSPAGGVTPNGYIRISLNGSTYFAHRLAWSWVTGNDPGKLEIDHRNHNPGDNRWKNIRLAKHDGNQRNTRLQKNNKSGIKGISWCNYYQRWVGRISIGPRISAKIIHVGYFQTLEEAAQAIRDKRPKVHGRRFSHHG